MSSVRSLSGGNWLVEGRAVACMKQQLAKLRGAGRPGCWRGKQDHRRLFQDAPVDPRQVALQRRCRHSQRWPASGFKPLKFRLGWHVCSGTSAASTQCPRFLLVASTKRSCSSNRSRISTPPCAITRASYCTRGSTTCWTGPLRTWRPRRARETMPRDSLPCWRPPRLVHGCCGLVRHH